MATTMAHPRTLGRPRQSAFRQRKEPERLGSAPLHTIPLVRGSSKEEAMRSFSANGGADPTLQLVLQTEELEHRGNRAPDQSSTDALRELAEAVATSPTSVLGRLVVTAMRVCRSGSAGISLSSSSSTLYWPVIVGAWGSLCGTQATRDSIPCGVVLDRNSAQLFSRPARYFPALSFISPQIEEALVAPVHFQGEAVGTLWVLTHTTNRKFDAEDKRLILELAEFASQAYAAMESFGLFRSTQRSPRRHRHHTLGRPRKPRDSHRSGDKPSH